MSDLIRVATSPLGGAQFEGFSSVHELGPVGMITLRAKAKTKGLAKAIKAVTACSTPKARKIETKGDHHVAWMSVDEYLIILPYDQVRAALAQIHEHLSEQHYLAVDVSDARALFQIQGDKADQVLRKLCPVDFDRLDEKEICRTRAAQVACAFWRDDGGFKLICFRSVAQYMMDLLAHSAKTHTQLW